MAFSFYLKSSSFNPKCPTNLTSIQENQNIRHEKHKTLTFPPLKTYLFLVSFGSSPLLSLVEHLESLKEKKNSPFHFALTFLSFLSFLSFLLSPLFSFLPSTARSPHFGALNLLKFSFISKFPKLPLNQIISLVSLKWFTLLSKLLIDPFP